VVESDDDESDADDAELRHQELAHEIESRVKSLDEEEATAYLDTLCSQWKLDDPPATYADTVGLYLSNYGIDMRTGLDDSDPGFFGAKGVEENARAREMEAMAMYHRLRELGLLEQEEVHAKIRSVMEAVYLSKKTVFLLLQGKIVERRLHAAGGLELDDDLDAQLGSWSLRFRWLDHKELSDVQKLLLHLLDAAMELKYKKQGSYCFAPIIVDSHKTHAYKKVCDIEEFVYDQCRKELQLDQWLNLTSGNNNAKVVVEYLTKTDDYQFKKLRKNRHVFAFKNGVYFAKENRFHRFDSGGLIDDQVVAAKYFELDFHEYDHLQDWYDIPTPYLHSILEYQQFPEEVLRWAYIFFGRLLYDVGDLDGWQCIPFFKGQGGSGKSSIINTVKDFYDPIDVGILSNNIEKKFGIGAMRDSYMFIAPEIKQDLAIEQAEFQSMVTGEAMSMAVKNKTAITDIWRPPGILAGNEVPAWADNSGSIQRRIILFGFEHAVKNGDMKLAEKIQGEMAAILLKCNRAYLQASQRWGTKNIWNVVPAYFKATRDEMAQAVNSVEAFLASSDVALGEGKFCPFDDFKMALKTFEHQNAYRSSKLVADLFRGPFTKFGIKRVKETRVYKGRSIFREYLDGVDMVDHESANELG
jgi:hypothetical protein